MNSLFPYDNFVVGVLILLIGFIFHWLGQLISVINWEFASKMGLQEAKLLKEYRVYEHAIAVADSLLGWIYGIAAIGLILKMPWGYKLAWFPGTVFIYHALSFWFWTRNRHRLGHQLESSSLRVGWTLANLVTGVFLYTAPSFISSIM